MQTFLPLPNFVDSARVLDWRRLGKQRVEAYQILQAWMDGTRWRNHPATRMWIDGGFQVALCDYAISVVEEWISRGYRDTMLPRFRSIRAGLLANGAGADFPPWFGDRGFHASHRSNLLRKDPTWYGQFGWREPPDLPYVWPR